ncbi:MAG: CCA tRNA nucleotidyltransferase [Holosporaceae bacterium]|jgi:tRNA nucleotidyltransferase/poly(A) polymerase|nr:CCA tRNA nucleotidyltransferase [Holosporaceae bacterium]
MGNDKKKDSINLPPEEELLSILNLIEKNGHKARVVGGAVRNFLLKMDISDIDIATTATPNEIIDIFSKNGIYVTPIGIEHGTVLISYGNKSYETTTLREDIQTFGRHAKVKFTKSFEIDSCRRDFTINAMYMDKNGKIFDYHSGMDDLKARNLRFIGDPHTRITEDYLRILRYFRFLASYGEYRANAEYLTIINELKSNLSALSSERILGELLKTFAISDSYKIVPIIRDALNELFDLKLDPLKICEKLNIYPTLSAEERIGFFLKFSSFSVPELLKKYNLPKNIKEIIQLPKIDLSQIFFALKNTKKTLRKFYAKYLVVKSYAEELLNEAEAKITLENLLDFCESEYVDFNLRAEHLQAEDLSERELKRIMIATKKFWMESSHVSVDECKNYAINHVKN